MKIANNMRNLNETFSKDVTYANIKSHKKHGFTLFSEIYIFGKTTGGAQIDPPHPQLFSG